MGKWTDKENIKLESVYGKVPTKDLESLFPTRKLMSIRVQAHKLGITGRKNKTKSDESKEKATKTKHHTSGNPICVCSCFRTAHVIDYNTRTFGRCLMVNCVCKGFVEDENISAANSPTTTEEVTSSAAIV